MAGDWIKMRADLFTHPKVVRIASALKADKRPDVLRVVGGLMSVWCLFDAHSVDGQLEGYTPDLVDDQLRWDGFCAAMKAVGWLAYEEGGSSMSLPDFDTHNGQSAKRRAQDADRKREDRKTSASEADKKRTREEKRRVVNTPLPPEGFEEFWNEWPKNPRKAAKAQCAAKWVKQGCDQNPEPVLAALRAAKASDEWKKDGGQFIPAPLVWLNQRRWEAFTDVQAQAKPGTPEYFAQHRRASWWQDAGFESVEDAHNNRCWHGNASEFTNGTRGEP